MDYYFIRKIIMLIIIFSAFFPLVRVTRLQQAGQKSGEPLPNSAKITLVSCILAITISGMVLAYDPYKRGPFHNPHIQAAAFEWPEGCPMKKYSETGASDLPRSCVQEKYGFPQWREYGFRSFGYRVPAPYYRIGNDAVAVSCPDFDKTSNCIVGDVVDDVFHQ